MQMERIVAFFQTGISPLDFKETFQITAFLEAAEESKKKKSDVLIPIKL